MSAASSVHYFTDSRELGGAEEALLLLIENLDRRRYEPTLLYNPSPALEPLVRRAEELDAPARAVPPLPLGVRGACGVPRFVAELRTSGPAVFHAHLSWPLAAKYPLLAAGLARVPAVVATVQLVPEFQVTRSTYVQERVLAHLVDRYIAVSNDVRQRVISRFGWPGDKVEVIYNGVPIERFQPGAAASVPEPSGTGTDGLVVLTVARLDPQKGLETLLEAAAKFEGPRYLVAGEGPERRRLESRIEELGLEQRVSLLGWRTDIPALLAASDVFVLPSLYEGSSLAVLEAMAAGKPVVTSAIGGTSELVDDGQTGLLVQPGDAHGLAAALQRLCADRALRSRLGSAAQSRARATFTASGTAERVMRLYDALLTPE